MGPGRSGVKSISAVEIELSVVLGAATIPIHQLLRMGRGAMIELDAGADDDVQILANDVPVARGRVLLRGERISVAVTEVMRRMTAEAQKAPE